MDSPQPRKRRPTPTTTESAKRAAKKALKSGTKPVIAKPLDFTADQLGDLRCIITIRWDEDMQRPVVNLGGLDPHTAAAWILQANEQVWEDLPRPLIAPK